MISSDRLGVVVVLLTLLLGNQVYAINASCPAVANGFASTNDLTIEPGHGLPSSAQPFEHSQFHGCHFQAEVHYRLDKNSGQAVPIQVIINKHSGPKHLRHQIVFVFATTTDDRPPFSHGLNADGWFNGQKARLTVQFNRDGTLRRLIQHNWNTSSGQRYIIFNCFEVQLPDQTVYHSQIVRLP